MEVVEPLNQTEYPLRSDIPSNAPPLSYNSEVYHGAYKPEHPYPLDMESQPMMAPIQGNPKMEEKIARNRRKVCGVKRWIFFTIAAIIALIIVGAVLGGVLGTQLKHNNSGSS